MATNLLKLLETEISSDVLSKIASFVGQGPATTRAALTNAAPAVLCALHQKSSSAGGSAELLDMLKRGGFDGAAVGSPANAVSSASGLADLAKVGAPLVASLFGKHELGVMDWLSSATGIGTAAASKLLGLAVPFVLNLIGRQLGSTGGFNAGSLTNLIRSQGSLLASSAPNGLARALGVSQCGEAAPAGAYAAGPVGAAEGDSLWKSVVPVLGILLLNLGFFAWRVYDTGQSQPAPVAVTTPPAVIAPVPAPPPASAPAPAPVPAGTALVKQSICAGQLLEIGANGVESRLIAFLDDKTSVVGANTQFSFDRLEFETDSAVLKPSSRAQLKNVAEIMKCYPTLELKIGGHTDSKADDAYNLKLSQERADSTKRELIGLGVVQSRLAAEGYGERFPIASNDTEEGRQRNRRTDIIVTKK